ncbi:MAG: subclass B1 metallo-beta-lactamase [Phycisphaerae bacterium]|nr:subclass B1 metallo-beta-lactamase [Phycisphaerae bacterium]
MTGHSPSAQRGLCVIITCACVLAGGCQSSQPAPRAESIRISDDVFVQPIAPGVWVHTTYYDLPNYGRCPANGLVVVDSNDALLIDLPWTDELTATLCDWLARNQGATVKTVVPTHWHQDCMGGLEEAHRRGAVSYGLDQTVEIARQKHLPVPQIPYRFRTMVHCAGTVALATYFGSGHTTDNVVVWLPQKQVLFGGCLIKSMDSQSLGNTTDGDLAAYPATLRKVQATYRHAKIVVPGHGDWGGPELIQHTLELCAPPKAKP